MSDITEAAMGTIAIAMSANIANGMVDNGVSSSKGANEETAFVETKI